MVNDEKFWKGLKTGTRNTLLRNKCEDPWNWTLPGLLRIPGIGPATISEIASVIEKNGRAP